MFALRLQVVVLNSVTQKSWLLAVVLCPGCKCKEFRQQGAGILHASKLHLLRCCFLMEWNIVKFLHYSCLVILHVWHWGNIYIRWDQRRAQHLLRNISTVPTLAFDLQKITVVFLTLQHVSCTNESFLKPFVKFCCCSGSYGAGEVAEECDACCGIQRSYKRTCCVSWCFQFWIYSWVGIEWCWV